MLSRLRLALGILLIVFFGAALRALPPTLLPMSVTFTVADFQPQMEFAGPMLSIARNPADLNEVFATSKHGGLWKSTNAGTNWVPILSLPVHDLSVVAYYTDGSIFVTSREDFRHPVNGAGIWRSGDHGASWEQLADVPRTLPGMPTPCVDQRAHGIAVNSSDGTVYAATSCGLLVSWEGHFFHLVPPENFPAGTAQQFYSVAFNRGGLLLVGGESGIFEAHDLGSFGHPPSFDAPTSGLAGTTMAGGSGEMRAAFAVSHSIYFPNFVVAVTRQVGIDSMILSGDGGRNWVPVSGKPPSPGGGAGGSPFVRITPKAGGSEDLYVYYGDTLEIHRAGPFVNGDLSGLPTATWNTIPLNHSDPHDLEFVHQPGAPLSYRALLIATDGGLEICSFRDSSDDVTACVELGTVRGLTSISAMNIKGQVIGTGETAVRNLYMQTWHDDIWRSTDDGANWDDFSCCEGFSLEMERKVDTVSNSQIAWDSCAPCNNNFQDGTAPGATFPNVSNSMAPPIMIRRGEFVQVSASPGSSIVSVTPNLSVATSAAPGWVGIATLVSGTGPVPIQGGWVPILTYDSSPGAASPILYQPYINGRNVALAVLPISVPSSRTGSIRLGGAPTFPAMQWLDPSGVVHPTSRTVSLGISWTPFEAFTFEPVLGVDPRFPSHLVTPDTNNGLMMESITTTGGRPTGRGAGWRPISDLSSMILNDAGGTPRFSFKYNRDNFGFQSLVSAISFCPDNSDLVIVGTVDNGLFFSMDNAATWRRIPGTEHIVNPTAIYWRSANSVLVSSDGRGLFEIRMRYSLPPSYLSLICSGCRILPAVPPLFAASITTSRNLQPQSISSLSKSPFDEVVLVLDGRITGADFVQGQLQNIWTTIGSGYVVFAEPNSKSGFAVKERTGFSGFKGLPEADQLRSQGEVVKGFVLSDGKVVDVIYGSKETPFPVSPAAGRIELPEQSYSNPIDPQITAPYLRLLTQDGGYIGPGDPLVLQGFNFLASKMATVSIDGHPFGQGFQADSSGRFVLNIVAPQSIGPHSIQIRQTLANEVIEAVTAFGVTNTDEDEGHDEKRNGVVSR